jgi:hypothetical protein
MTESVRQLAGSGLRTVDYGIQIPSFYETWLSNDPSATRRCHSKLPLHHGAYLLGRRGIAASVPSGRTYHGVGFGIRRRERLSHGHIALTCWHRHWYKQHRGSNSAYAQGHMKRAILHVNYKLVLCVDTDHRPGGTDAGQ